MLLSVPAVEVVFYRVSISAVALLGFLLWTGRGLFGDGMNTTSRQLATGILVAIHWILFFLSARISNVSVSLVGMATCSLWTALMEPFYTKKRIQAVDVLLSLIAVLGMVIIFNVEVQYWLGLVVAIASAFVAAIFTIINAQFIQQGRDPYVITFYEMTGASLIILIFMPLYSIYFDGLNLTLTGWDFLWIGLLSLVCTVYAYSISVKIMKYLTPYVVNLTINLEPVYGIALAVLIFGSREEMSRGFYLGACLILMAVLAYPLINRWRNRRPLKNRHSAI